MGNTSVRLVAQSPVYDIINSRLARAASKWNEANARYIKARIAFDAQRLANAKAEATSYYEFAQAKALVKEATDAYYAIVASVNAVKTAVSAARTESQIAELESRLEEERKRLAQYK